MYSTIVRYLNYKEFTLKQKGNSIHPSIERFKLSLSVYFNIN